MIYKEKIKLWVILVVTFSFAIPLNGQVRLDQLLTRQNKSDNRVFVAAHRGDWRNAPENSLRALKNSIEMGVDIMELDVKKTKDGHLIVMHDNTIDRSTEGKGKPEDFTLEEIRKIHLKNGLGRATENTIPTFREMLLEAKGKILIDVDKGYGYFPDVIKELKETGTLNQAVININDNTYYDSIVAKYGNVEDDIFIMPIINCKDPNARAIINSYKKHRNTIFQPVFDQDNYPVIADLPALRNDGFGVWINSLWASLSGGHDDDRAVERNQPDETWGWLIDHGANIIQTDRPEMLLNFLRKKKLHE
jgi:glycerophosphoryl diester phosphodiesterase